MTEPETKPAVKIRYWRRLRRGWGESAKVGPWHAILQSAPYWANLGACGVDTYRSSNYGASNTDDGERPTEGRLCPKCVKATS